MKHRKIEIFFGGSAIARDSDGVAYETAIALEDVQAFLLRQVVPVFPAFTLTEGLGYWNGKAEKQWTLTIIVAEDAAPKHVIGHWEGEARVIAENYAAEFNQEAVAYAVSECGFALTTPQARYLRSPR